MTWQEFQGWLQHFGSRFTGIDAFLGKRKSADETLKAWYEVLADLDLAECKRATVEMHSGTTEPPRDWDRYPAAIRKIVVGRDNERIAELRRNQRPRYVGGGEETYRCAVCRDEGSVLVYQQFVVRAVLEGKAWHPTENPEGSKRLAAYSCLVQCSCEMGRVKAPNVQPVYDERDHVRCDALATDWTWCDRQEWYRIVEWSKTAAVEEWTF